MTLPIVEDRSHSRNGFYDHSSFRKPHRLRVVDVGGMSVVLAVIAGLLCVAGGLTWLAVWMFKNAFDLVAGH